MPEQNATADEALALILELSGNARRAQQYIQFLENRCQALEARLIEKDPEFEAELTAERAAAGQGPKAVPDPEVAA